MHFTEMPSVNSWMEQWESAPSPLDYINREVSLENALSMANLVFPTFAKRWGCLVGPWVDGEAVDSWIELAKGDIPTVEFYVNKIELGDIFGDDGDAADQALSHLLVCMERGWTLSLGEQFPDGNFRVITEDGNDGPWITVRRDSPGSTP